MQLLVLWSHKFKEAKYERGVSYTGLNKIYFFFGLPASIQVGLGTENLSFLFPICMLRLRLFLIQPL